LEVTNEDYASEGGTEDMPQPDLLRAHFVLAKIVHGSGMRERIFARIDPEEYWPMPGRPGRRGRGLYSPAEFESALSRYLGLGPWKRRRIEVVLTREKRRAGYIATEVTGEEESTNTSSSRGSANNNSS
jgi:hypothetical protein